MKKLAALRQLLMTKTAARPSRLRPWYDKGFGRGRNIGLAMGVPMGVGATLAGPRIREGAKGLWAGLTGEPGAAEGGSPSEQAADGEPGMMSQAWDWAKENPWSAAGIGAGIPLAGYGIYKALADDEED